jgi:hypothetical protein
MTPPISIVNFRGRILREMPDLPNMSILIA